MFKHKKLGKRLMKVVNNHNTTNTITETQTKTNASVLDYKPMILSTICTVDWTGKVFN